MPKTGMLWSTEHTDSSDLAQLPISVLFHYELDPGLVLSWMVPALVKRSYASAALATQLGISGKHKHLADGLGSLDFTRCQPTFKKIIVTSAKMPRLFKHYRLVKSACRTADNRVLMTLIDPIQFRKYDKCRLSPAPLPERSTVLRI